MVTPRESSPPLAGLKSAEAKIPLFIPHQIGGRNFAKVDSKKTGVFLVVTKEIPPLGLSLPKNLALLLRLIFTTNYL